MKKFVYLIIVLLGMYLIINLSKSVFDLWGRKSRIETAEKTKALEKRKNEELMAKKAHVEKEEFIEKEARETRLLRKPGESTVIIDPSLIEAISGTKSAAETKDPRPNWQQWWELFFK